MLVLLCNRHATNVKLNYKQGGYFLNLLCYACLTSYSCIWICKSQGVSYTSLWNNSTYKV